MDSRFPTVYLPIKMQAVVCDESVTVPPFMTAKVMILAYSGPMLLSAAAETVTYFPPPFNHAVGYPSVVIILQTWFTAIGYFHCTIPVLTSLTVIPHCLLAYNEPIPTYPVSRKTVINCKR